jgi:hypothetical protein
MEHFRRRLNGLCSRFESTLHQSRIVID